MSSRPVTVTLSHEHTKEEARRRLDENLDKLTSQLGSVAKVEHEWSGDTLNFRARAMMQTVTGDLTVFDDHVRITVVLPGLLAGMAEKVSGNIRKQGQILLEKK
ncbi:polyhydroxyalkanoic acid system family protein [Parvularcula oceani]|uniref:polyhydroxyalkanoic acid system family protein n=1 Tax=Parvularcula oceani TaxID=1247963 RepID=UPI0004E1B074|nr:polyhydroxyalkanoic acid system family protein [Parvularcula oceani]